MRADPNRRATDGFDHLINKGERLVRISGFPTAFSSGPTGFPCRFPRQTWSTILQNWNKPWNLTVADKHKAEKIEVWGFFFPRDKIRIQNRKTERITPSISKNPLVKIRFKRLKPQTTTSAKLTKLRSRYIYYLELGSVRKLVITNANTLERPLERNLPKQLCYTMFLFERTFRYKQVHFRFQVPDEKLLINPK